MHIIGNVLALLMVAAVIFVGYCMVKHKPIKLFGRTFDPFKD